MPTPEPDWWIAHPPSSLAELVVHHAQATPDRRLISRREGGGWTQLSAAALRDEVDAIALGLIEAGVAPGDRVALMSKTRYEWTLIDLAIWAAGAVGVPVYESSAADQLAWILSDSGAVAAVVENRGHADLLATVWPNATTGDTLPRGWTIDPSPGWASVTHLAAAGRTRRERDPAAAAAELQDRRATLSPDSLATLIYTSGTTGRPKGVRLTHANFLAEVTSAIEYLPELFDDPDASTLLFLPLAHVFGRMIEVAAVLKGIHLGHSDVARISRDLPAFQPTFVLAVPRVFERVYDGARRKAVSAGRARIFDGAVDTAIRYSTALDTGRPNLALRVLHAIYSRLVYGKILTALGGSAQWAVSGGAALGPRLGHFFRGIGLTILEGYGLTETTAAATVNTPTRQRIGSVGRPLPGFEVRIADDGEVQVRGGHVFAGYWDNEAATTEALTVDGWLRTGDLGVLDDEGYLTITGRAKEIIVTSAGKNVSPAPLEDVVRSCPLVSQALVVGDGRPQIAALVTLDPDAVAAWLEQHGRPPVPIADLVDDPQVRAEVKTVVDRANASVSSAERIARFRILAVDWTEAGGHLTPSLKLKRSVILADFAADVEALYTR